RTPDINARGSHRSSWRQLHITYDVRPAQTCHSFTCFSHKAWCAARRWQSSSNVVDRRMGRPFSADSRRLLCLTPIKRAPTRSKCAALALIPSYSKECPRQRHLDWVKESLDAHPDNIPTCAARYAFNVIFYGP